MSELVQKMKAMGDKYTWLWMLILLFGLFAVQAFVLLTAIETL